jgi:hypothetical protein
VVRERLGFAFGFAQASDSVAGFPLAPFFQKFQSLKSFKHIALPTQGGRRSKTAML